MSWDRSGSNNPNWRGGNACICQSCGKDFNSTGCDRQVKYCPTCRPLAMKGEKNPNWKPRTVLTCPCGKEFSATSREVKRGRKFCGIICSNISRNQNKQSTNIERLVQQWLETHLPGQFKTQVTIPGVGIVDFLIGTSVLECDGIYWHTKPGRAAYDLRRDAKLNKLGYPVIRFSSDEIERENLDTLIRQKALVATLHNQWRQSWQ